MSGALRFEILGPQRAWHGEQEIDTGPGKQRAVLAVLLLSPGRSVPTGQLVDAVWPDDPPANGPNVVQKYVAGLRRVLEPDRSPRAPGQVLTLTEAGYLLRVPPEAVDAVRFERSVRRAQQARAEGRTAEAVAELRAATELWRGEPLPGLPGPFFESARYRLVELRATALETRVELELELGRHRELAGELTDLVAEFPLRERLRHQLMLALYRSGRQAEALAAYREIGELLREEYGIEPGNALQELHRRILRSDPALNPPAQPTPSVPTAPTTTSTPATVPAPPGAVPAPVDAMPAAVQMPSLPSAATVSRSPVPAGWPPALTPGVPVLPVPPARPVWHAPRWISVTATVAATAVVLLSFGALTWAVVLGYAAWRRSWRLALAGLGYLALVGSLLCLALTSDPEAEPPDGELLYVLSVVAVCWCVGTVHVVLLSRGFRGLVRRVLDVADRRGDEERRARREQARYLLHHHPAARHELRIGRPDLPRVFDDGGLVDVNAVGDQVLAGLPGLTPDQCRHIVTDRLLRGPYSSVEELAGRCLLSPAVTEHLRHVLVFLPPPGPPPAST
ncbi:BTAD domain-containing putative transcriptional regulator [Micromonospora sp. KC213]|uniref:BTAD domain-containing putative transcriptional regulator n=1 Tax=Micromonospora sp. KC213 TaxID=2530378 RepID=UPI0010486D42|nr:BTAD domain-containing putative transcriptional regulator [Micromonospora sp. KC213]TDC39482.1 transcriptional regulator [Micromonospora sp. KC213]